MTNLLSVQVLYELAKYIVSTAYDRDAQSPHSKYKHLRADIRCWCCGRYTLGEVDEGENHLTINHPEVLNHESHCIVLKAEEIIKLLGVAE